MTIALIAAAAGKDLVIGKNGDLPWHFSADLKYFKEKTSGHPVVMGRVTYQSIVNRLGKPLPGRQNIVLTHDKNFRDDRVTIIHDVSEMNALAKNNETLFVIGGAKVYEQTLAVADVVYLTHVEQDVVGGDAFFPTLDNRNWYVADETITEENGVKLRFCVYKPTPMSI